MAIFSLLGTAIAGALFGGSALAATLIAGGLAFGASLLVQSLMRQNTPGGQSRTYSAVQGQVQYGADVPVGTFYGTGKTKGHRVYYAKWGSGNKFNADVLVLGNGWCDGLEPEIYFYGEKYALFARPIIGNEVAHYGVTGFDNLISIRLYDGRPGQGPDTKLVADTAALGQNWKSTSVGAGVTYVVVEREYEVDRFSKGRPEFEFVLRGMREYDPRKDTTVAGGSGPQRIDNPATWVFTKNPAVHRLNYQIGLRGLISQRSIIGEGKSLGQLDLGTYFAAMNVCDTVRAATGKPTYEAALYVTGEDDHTEVIKEFDDAMAGYALNRRGLSGVIPGAPQIPVADITAVDIPIGRGQEMQRRKSAFNLYNYMSGQFISKESQWNAESLKPVFVNADVAADGRPRQIRNDFLQVTDPDIGQYLMSIRYRQNRKGGSATVPVSRRLGLNVQEGEWVTFDGLTWLVTGWRCDSRLRITLILSETGADVYSDAGIEPGPIVIPPTPPINPSLLSTVQDFDVEVGFIADTNGKEVPALHFTWTPPADPTITQVRFFYFVGDNPTGQTIYQDTTSDPEAGAYTTTKNVIQGVFYTARATITTVPDRFKSFTPWVTTLTATGPFDAYGNLDLPQIGTQFQDLLLKMGQDLRVLIEWAQNQAAITGDQEMANATQFDEMRRSLATVSGDLSATFEETITTAIIPMNGQLVALADAFTELSAGDGDAVNTARWRMTVMSGPVGYSQIGMESRFDNADSGDFRTAGMFILTPNNPLDPTQMLFDAQRFVFGDLSSGSVVNPLVYDAGIWRVNNLLVGSASIQSAAITNAKIADAAITNAKIVDATITGAKIANATIGSAQIANAAITNAQLGTAVIQTANIVSGNVSQTFISQHDADLATSTTDNVPTVVETLSINISIGPVVIFAQVTIDKGADTDPYVIYLRKNGSLFGAFRGGGGSGQQNFDMVYVDNAPGSVTYELCYEPTSNMTAADNARFRSLVAINNKV